MSTETVKTQIRLPDGLMRRLAEAAKTSGRSMNAELVVRLRESLDAPAQTEKAMLFGSGYVSAIMDMLMANLFADEKAREHALAFGHDMEKYLGVESRGPRTLTALLPAPSPVVPPASAPTKVEAKVAPTKPRSRKR